MICPICGRAQLSEAPHVHQPTRSQPPLPYRDTWANGRASRYQLLDPDPLHVEPEPVDDRDPAPARRGWGCSIVPWLVLAVAVWGVGR